MNEARTTQIAAEIARCRQELEKMDTESLTNEQRGEHVEMLARLSMLETMQRTARQLPKPIGKPQGN